jgi:hypothetical protein
MTNVPLKIHYSVARLDDPTVGKFSEIWDTTYHEPILRIHAFEEASPDPSCDAADLQGAREERQVSTGIRLLSFNLIANILLKGLVRRLRRRSMSSLSSSSARQSSRLMPLGGVLTMTSDRDVLRHARRRRASSWVQVMSEYGFIVEALSVASSLA